MDVELQHRPNSTDNPRSSMVTHFPSRRGSHETNVNAPVDVPGGEAVTAVEVEEPDGQQLPPTDRGIDAWRMLFAACIFEALLWGMAYHMCPFEKIVFVSAVSIPTRSLMNLLFAFFLLKLCYFAELT